MAIDEQSKMSIDVDKTDGTLTNDKTTNKC